MPRRAVVPIPELAVTFVEAVENGKKPMREWATLYGLTFEQIDKRSWRLRKTGWLPPGSYRREGWLEEARALLDERLRWLAAREELQEQRMERRVQLLRARLVREQTPLVPKQYRTRIKAKAPSNGSVLDFFG